MAEGYDMWCLKSQHFEMRSKIMSIDVCVSLAVAYSQTSKDTMTSSNKLETVKVNFRHLEAPASHQPVTCSVATAVVALI